MSDQRTQEELYEKLIGSGSSEYDRHSTALSSTSDLLDARDAPKLLEALSSFAGLDPFLATLVNAARARALEGLSGDFSTDFLVVFCQLYLGLFKHQGELPLRVFRSYLEGGLGFRHSPAISDRVAAVFEGDSKKLPLLLDKGTLINAGALPPSQGRGERLYQTEQALAVEPAELARVATVFRQNTRRGWISPVANSRDGLGEEFEDTDDPLWPSMGAPSRGEAIPHELRILSPLLDLRSGERQISLSLYFTSTTGLSQRFFSEWNWELVLPIGRIRLRNPGYRHVNFVILSFTIHQNESFEPHPEGAEIPKVPYLSIRPPSSGANRNFAFGLQIEVAQLRVNVNEMVPDKIWTQDGESDPTKPFYPFGISFQNPQDFYLASPEALRKDIQEMTITVKTEDFESLENPVLNFYQGNSVGAWTSLGSAESNTEFRLDNVHSVKIPCSEKDEFLLQPPERRSVGWIKISSGSQPDPEDLTAKPPPPPRISRIRINYDSGAQAVSLTNRELPNHIERFLGVQRIDPGAAERVIEPFPQFSAVKSHLYLGFDKVSRTKLLTLFFDVEPRPDVPLPSPDDEPMGFEFSDGLGGWASARVDDQTFGLRQSGILTVSLPQPWKRGCPELGDAFGGPWAWLRLTSATPTHLARIRGIYPNAVMARYQVRDPFKDGTSAVPLASLSLKRLKKPVPGIKKVINPCSSFGGRAPEDDQDFSIRAAERLRHRGRGVTPWDYERLVLQQFPEVRLVRCIPHLKDDCLSAPGAVSLVIVPWSDSASPRISEELRNRITSFLEARCSPGISILPISAVFVRVSIEAKIVISRDAQPFAVEELLREGLSQVLSPWRVASIGSSAFGIPMYRSQIVRWLESQPGVDHTERLVMRADDIVTEVASAHPGAGLVSDAESHRFEIEVDL